jgi:hypothetical protein
VAVFSTARIVLLALGCYWLGLLTLTIAGAASVWGMLVLRHLSRRRLPGARLAISWIAGMSAAGSVLLTVGAAGAAAGGQPPVLRYLGPNTRGSEVSDAARRPEPVKRVRPPVNPAPVPAVITPRAAPVSAQRSAQPAQLPAGPWTVRPGDSFWSISEDTLTAAWGRPPTDREIAPFWLEVIAANRDRLPDPGHPNLLFPGDVVAVPRPPEPQ